MKETITLGTSVGREYEMDWQLVVRETLESLKPLEERISSSGRACQYIFDYYPTDIEMARMYLKSQEIDSTIVVERQYTEDELLIAPYLFLDFSDQVASTEDKPLRRSEPRPLLCEYCEFYKGEWIIHGVEIEDSADDYRLAFLDWNVRIISHLLADQLKHEKYTGLDLTQIGGDIIPKWYSLSSNHVLPQIKTPPTILTPIYPRMSYCLPNHGLSMPRTEIYYSKSGFKAQDFNMTWEYFGERTGGNRMMIISNRVYRKLLELNVKHLECEPIRFVEDVDIMT